MNESEVKSEEKVEEKKEEKITLPKPYIRLEPKIKRLLKLRIRMERKEPDWMRMDEWRFWRIERKDSWRRPKGLDNKIRKEKKGYPPRVKIGYGKPAKVRHLHPSGFEIVRVFNPEDLNKVNPTKQAIVIASTVGLRKKIEIVKKAIEKGIKILNLTKDVKKELGLE